MQADWIGKSYGAEVDFPVEGRDEKITVYTTRPDTLYGATFMVLAPEHKLAKSLATDETRADVEAYIQMAANKSSVDRLQGKEKTGLFAAGVLFGTAGIKILTSKDAKKFYTQCTAAVLRAKECVMKTVTSVQENAEDIYAEAKEINEERAAQDAELGADVTVEETDITEDAEESAEQE